MNRESFDGKKVETFDDLFGAPAGSYFIKEATEEKGATHKLYFVLPNDQAPCGINIAEGKKFSKVWKWNGDFDKPTIEPSIHTIGRWHGWLTHGRFTSC